MRGVILLGMTAACVGVGAAVSASGQESWKPDLTAERSLGAFAVCAVKREAVPVRDLLSSSPVAPDAMTRMIAFLDHSKCTWLMGTLKMKHNVMRGALAQQLYVSTYTDAPRPVAAIESHVAAIQADPALIPYLVGACAARRDPVSADAPVRAKRRSVSEATLARQLAPALNACAGSTKVALGGAQFHGVLAEGLLKLRAGAAQGMN